MKHRAFTLVEIVVVVLVVGIVTAGLALSLNNGRAQAEFKNAEYQVTNLLQEARSLSLANILIEDESGDFETDYYHLSVTRPRMILTAYGTNDSGSAVSQEIDTVELSMDHELSFDGVYDIYYVPPYGELCFSYSGGCVFTGQPTELSFDLTREEVGQTRTFTISIYSGYPEID